MILLHVCLFLYYRFFGVIYNKYKLTVKFYFSYPYYFVKKNPKDPGRLNTFKVTQLEGLEPDNKVGSDSRPMFCVCSCIMPSTW